MASLRVHSAVGGPRIGATRTGRPTALRLLLLLGAVLKPQESLAQLLTTPDSMKLNGIIASCNIVWKGKQTTMAWASPTPGRKGSSLRLTSSTLPTAPWCSPPSQIPQRMCFWP
ncbi:receptor activity modifying protein 2 [Rhinolophus ferrumequinum]|uniref:Receptor activity modifying protein 2 n=1 Tax=Rhinolophus ferrumequinum TaxID=59479 RepID=A0A671EMC3_RHIFE|nr:receptor activity modifying protein 2 [Rhinolophus ferrumequinum]